MAVEAAPVVLLGGLRAEDVAVLPVGETHARAAEALRRATTKVEDAKPLAKTDSKASLRSVDDDVGPTVAISEDDLDKTNYYELLGLEKSGGGVDNDVLKKAYNKAVLLYHPDKSNFEDDTIFLAVQKAYDTLRDPTKRRAYDSTNDFDESIPSGKEASQQGDAFDFYATYGPVFRSNGRFAEKRPVPDLGDEGTDEKAVDAFYAYWVRFESWRNFDLEMREHDPDAADDRYEKRYMKKENAKLAAKRKREEMERIITLVERARANDPRLKRFAEARALAKKEAREKREREKRDKELAAQAAADALAEEKANREKAEKEARQAASADKKTLKKAKRRAEKLLKAKNQDARDGGDDRALSDLDFLKVVEDLDAQETQDLAARADDDLAGVLEVLRAVLRGERAPKVVEKKKVVKLDSGPKAGAPWTEPELKMLDKACKRFKAGSMQRWEQVADYLNSQLALQNPRTSKECIAQFQKPLVDPKAHASKVAAAAAAPPPPPAAGPADDWSDAQQKQLEVALRRFPASLDKNERWTKIAGAVDGKSKMDCVARFKQLRAAIQRDKK